MNFEVENAPARKWKTTENRRTSNWLELKRTAMTKELMRLDVERLEEWQRRFSSVESASPEGAVNSAAVPPGPRADLINDGLGSWSFPRRFHSTYQARKWENARRQRKWLKQKSTRSDWLLFLCHVVETGRTSPTSESNDHFRCRAKKERKRTQLSWKSFRAKLDLISAPRIDAGVFFVDQRRITFVAKFN